MGAGTTVESGDWCNSGWAHARPEKVSRTLSQFCLVARVRRLYVLHYDDQQTVCDLCMCVSVLYESVQKAPLDPLS